MKKNLKPTAETRRRSARNPRKGIALITVLALLAITTLLIAAFFSLAKVELVSSDTYANGIRSRQLADTTVNIAISQIRKGTVAPEGRDTINYAWASQPGAIRKYDIRGDFYEAHKLYSDSNMVVDRNEGEETLVKDAPPTDWKDQPHRYVDLNSPVVRHSSSGEVDQRFYPIIDPRAAEPFSARGNTEKLEAIEGFTYTDTYFNGNKDPEVVLPGGSTDFIDSAARIPMPVEWLYTLEDGTIGFLDDEDRFVGTAPDGSDVVATPDNPIVGRIAFWTDDESSKININTASEPTFWNVPWVYSEIDKYFALYQPGRREYQRYPGHPATTALSPVLFPSLYKGVDSNTDPIAGAADLRDRKEQIFEMIPRIGIGGSRSGTVPVTQNPTGDSSNFAVQPVEIDDDRLYASLDEFIYSTKFETTDAGERRLEINEVLEENYSQPLGLDSRGLQRAQFFLTAKSRAPETNMFNMPRISMWPIHRKAVRREMGGDGAYDEKFGTGFDNMISFCSTINSPNGKVPYYFMREDSENSRNDLREIRSNWKIFTEGYLWDLVDSPVPGYGRSFTQKYGRDEAHQIMTEIFDYVRCTNLHDDLLAPEVGFEPVMMTNNAGNLVVEQPYRPSDSKWYSFTAPRDKRAVTRIDEEDEHYRIFPGHGQVTPIEVPNKSGGTSRGLGRFFTISEVAFHFICCADGNQMTGGHDAYEGTSNEGWAVYNKDLVEIGTPHGTRVRNHLANFAWPDDGADISMFGGAAGVSRGRALRDDSGSSYTPPTAPDGRFWYSGFPPLPRSLIPPAGTTQSSQVDPNQYAYKTKNPNYPGYDPRNWNFNLAAPYEVNAGTLDGILLEENERLVQCMLHIETFCPSLGYTAISPEMHIEIRGLDQLTLEGYDLFRREEGPYYVTASGNFIDGGQRGGANGVRGFYRSKHIPARKRQDSDVRAGGIGTLQPDNEWTQRSTRTGGARDWLLHPVVSDIITVKSSGQPDKSTMTFGGGRLTLLVKTGRSPDYHKISGKRSETIQSFSIQVPGGEFVTPQIVLTGTPRRVNARTGNISAWASGPPYWWSFNRNGCVGGSGPINNNTTRSTAVLENGQPNHASRSRPSRRAGRVISQWPGLYEEEVTGRVSEQDDIRNGNFIRREDTVQSLLPWHGDYRHVLINKRISTDLFEKHKNWGTSVPYKPTQHAHNLYVAQRTDRAPGFSYPNITMLSGVGERGTPYPTNRWPDFPDTTKSRLAQRYVELYKDFDNGMANAQDGPYINKPDEGDTRIRNDASFYDAANQWRANIPYLTNTIASEAAGQSYFSPNRQIPSPGMFGSLPSGSKGTPGWRGGRPEPWRTLLFRPPSGQFRHPGERNMPSQGDIPDHLWMDLFWMPIVEPYAISEPFSTAGKINLNYQILPFTNIKRATGIHALLKGEKLLCYRKSDTLDAKRRPGRGDTEGTGNERWWDNSEKKWWRDVDVEETLKQFEDGSNGKFDRGELFRSASEICEVNIVPDEGRVSYNAQTKSYKMVSAGGEFYANEYKVTGDNSRERPYTNIYPRITTKSNSFQVHYRTQAIQKSTFTDPERFVPNRDAVTSEYRGSSIIERYIDPNDAEIPDYRNFKKENPPPLDNFYRYRIVSTKRFAP